MSDYWEGRFFLATKLDVPNLDPTHPVDLEIITGYQAIAGRGYRPEDFDVLLVWKEKRGGAPQPPPTPPPAGDPELAAAEIRIMAYAATKRIGTATAPAFRWDGLFAEGFTGGPDSNGNVCLVVDGPGGPKVVHSGFYVAYRGNDPDNGPNVHIRLGAPLDLEHQQDGWEAYQTFVNGYMTWKRGDRVRVNVR